MELWKRIGPFQLDEKRKLLFRDGVQVPLGRRAIDLLAALSAADGWPVSKAELMEAAWPGLAVEESNLNVQIGALRKALGDGFGADDVILTLPRYGYQLVLPDKRTRAVIGQERGTDSADSRGRPGIAVLPFEELSADASRSYFADGLTEDLTTALGQYREFLVIATSTMSDFRGRSLNLREIGAKLGVQYFLCGSVRADAEQVRVSAQLLEAATGKILWANRFDGAVGSVFAIQDEITRKVITEIGSEVLVAEHANAARKPPSSLNAWECFVRAIVLSARLSQDDSREALTLLERATALDPSYARALGLQAWTDLWRTVQGWDDRQAAIARCEVLISRAMAADVREPWAWNGFGILSLLRRDFDEAIKSFETAVDVGPNFVLSWGMLGIAHAFSGNPAQGLQALQHAMKLSPREMFVGAIAQQFAFAHFAAGDYEQALQHARHAHLLRPGHVYPLVVAAASAGHLGQQHPASEFARSLRRLAPHFTGELMRHESPFKHQADRDRLAEGLIAAERSLASA